MYIHPTGFPITILVSEYIVVIIFLQYLDFIFIIFVRDSKVINDVFGFGFWF